MKIRRVVTGKDREGKSIVKWDSEIESIPIRPHVERVNIWAIDSLPAKLTEDDPANRDLRNILSNGSIFIIAQYEPGVSGWWHASDTIDYGIVLSGELWMQLEKDEVHLCAGDVVIQRETNHNWVNRGDQVCVIVFVLFATESGKSTG